MENSILTCRINNSKERFQQKTENFKVVHEGRVAEAGHVLLSPGGKKDMQVVFLSFCGYPGA
jgi:hypothetical protein